MKYFLSLFIGLVLIQSSFSGSVKDKDQPLPETQKKSEKESNDVKRAPLPREFNSFYERLVGDNDNKLIWFDKDGNLTARGDTAFSLLTASTEHGISSKKFRQDLAVSKDITPKDADIALTKVMLEYIDQMSGGKRRATFIKKHPGLSKAIDAHQMLYDGVLSDAKASKLDNFLPKHEAYIALCKSYAALKKLWHAEKDSEPTITWAKPMKKGEKGKHIGEVKDFLIFYGYLEKPKEEERAPASSNSKAPEDIYDDGVVEGVKAFQASHSLDIDGAIGANTLKMMKLSLQDKINLIRLNLERWRYLNYPLEDKFLMVNIPSYRVEGYSDGKRTFITKSIVGLSSRKTPLFKAPLFQVIINPSWGVPYNIAVHDKLRKIQNDPDYLSRAGFTVTDQYTGESVDPSEVSWDSLEAGNFPYQLRQHPGRSNALGVIKFDIKNNFTIYLHDTNQPELFKKNKRNLSSGCVRLHSPLGLASWVFEDTPYSDTDVLTKLINAHSTKHLPVKEHVPVYFVYITTWVDEEGHTFFSDDPYNMDEKELKAIEEDSSTTPTE